MSDYTLKGVIKDNQNSIIKNVLVQVMDSDQKWYEDRNDDIIDSKWVNEDGTFEISFDRVRFKDGILEEQPEIYLIIRNSFGQVIYTTEPKIMFEGSGTDGQKTLYFEIILASTEKTIPETKSDPYLANNERVISAFRRLGDISEFQLNDVSRILRLLNTSINAWSLYTTDFGRGVTGYDGPQVPRYPWRIPDHSHNLGWEEETK